MSQTVDEKKTSDSFIEYGNIQSSFDYVMRFDMPKGAKILDLGCNHGTLLHKLFLQGYNEVYGIDVRDEVIQIGKQEYPNIADRLLSYEGQELPYKDESFDVVLMFDVIEHIPEVGDFLASQVIRVLKPGGLLVFQTPNKIINIPWEIIQKKSFTAYKSFHCSLQTKGSLQKMLDKTGFSKIVIEKYDIITDHNLKKMREKLGFIAKPLLYTLQQLPLAANPNFWGSSVKE